MQFREGDSLDGMILQGRAMLKALLTDPVCRSGRVIAVGEAFCVPLPDAGSTEPKPLIGEYDLVIEDAEGTIIVDWKTAARRWPEGKADLDLQPTCYLYARQVADNGSARFRFDVVTKTVTPAVLHLETSRDEDRFRRLEALVEVVSALVQAEHFLPSEQSFAYSDCAYAEACREWHRCRARHSVTFSKVE
jgi:Holliday junction resolvase-like predicted endonuclease